MFRLILSLFMYFILGLFAGILFLFASQGFSKSFKLPQDRTIGIFGHIMESDPLALTMLGTAHADDGPIYIVIDSPGGSIDHGEDYIKYIKIAKNNGVSVECIVTKEAYSMAFMILTHCSKRYALKTAQLMFHPPSVMVKGIFRLVDIIELTKQLVADHLRGMNALMFIGLPMNIMLQSYWEEWFWKAPQLSLATNGWLEIVGSVEVDNNGKT